MPSWYRPLSSLWNAQTTSATTSSIYDVWWPSQTATASTTSSQVYWSNVANAQTWATAATTSAVDLYQQQALANAYAQAMLGRGIYQPSGLGSLFNTGDPPWRPSAPTIITRRREAAQREQEAYRRALEECNEQEAARLLRMIEQREMLDAEQRRIVEEQREVAAMQQRERDAAKLRARELLFEHLTPAQRETVERNGWFIVEGGKSKTQYRISTRGGAAGNIEVLTVANRVAHRLCCHAQSHIPLGDQWLSQKIMLELAEDDFLRIANRHAA